MKYPIHPLPYAADVAFAIRDDDSGYFCGPDKLETLYGDAWNRHFKVSFAVIPVQRGTNNLNVPPKFRNDGKYYPVNQNKELTSYLKGKISQSKAEILQHGFCHTSSLHLPLLKYDFEKGNLTAGNRERIDLTGYSEFYKAAKEDVICNVEKGRGILQDAFEVPVKVFVSPQEYLTKPLWVALWKQGMDYCGSIGRNIIAGVPVRHINFYPVLKVTIKKTFNTDTSQITKDKVHFTDIITLQPTYRHYWNKYITDRSAEYWFEQFKTMFENQIKCRGYFILLTHYFEYFYDWQKGITQGRQYEYLNRIFNYVDKTKNVWKCSLSELAEWFRAKDSIKIKRSREKIEVVCPYNVRGLSIKLEGENHKHLHIENAEVRNVDGRSFLILDLTANQKRDFVVG